MRYYRIAAPEYAPDSFEGARLYGGRWNSPGHAVIYACETCSGAMLEMLVHTAGRMPKQHVCVTFEAPRALKVTTLNETDVPDWNLSDMIASRAAGDAWLRAARTVVLRVPSVVFPVERNVLLNPAHRDFPRIKVVSVEPVRWDDRLFPRR
jgi:RES domain-containing protein